MVFHVGWGVGAAQATLTEGFPSWWVLRHTRHPKSLSSLFMEMMKHRPLFYHDYVNWPSRFKVVLRCNCDKRKCWPNWEYRRIWYKVHFTVPFISSKNTADKRDSRSDECLPLSHPNRLCHGEESFWLLTYEPVLAASVSRFNVGQVFWLLHISIHLLLWQHKMLT